MTAAEAIEKCKKLQALSASTTFPAEKQTASAMRRQLMKRHGLKAKDLKPPQPATSRRRNRRQPTEQELEDLAVRFAASFLARLFGRDFVSQMQRNL